jgi:hypothetical protein
MNRLSTIDRARAIACLVDGNSQRATCRIMDLSRKAVARLADEIGAASISSTTISAESTRRSA